VSRWIIVPSGAIHWAQLVPSSPWVSDERGNRGAPAWVAACDARNGRKGWLWTLAEVRELDHRPATANICFFCRALIGVRSVDGRQLNIFEGEA
jgi:hypothetical protein